MTLKKIILSKIEVFFLKHFEIWWMNTCKIDLGVFVLPFTLFHRIINKNHSSERGLDQRLSHSRDNKEHRSRVGWGVGARKGQGQAVPMGLWYCLLLPPASAVLECDFKYLVYALNTTRPFATFLPSACLYIPALDFKIKTFIIKTNGRAGSFNPTPPKEVKETTLCTIANRLPQTVF